MHAEVEAAEADGEHQQHGADQDGRFRSRRSEMQHQQIGQHPVGNEGSMACRSESSSRAR